ncbi:MAG: bifunctional alpha,alpha-trehalose-phosphate synthase (UDP-forming)/trehalose-phosphatase [Myxococcota bacterium]
MLSNRLPVTLKRTRGALKAERSGGGLVAAMEPAMRQRGGVWIGWPGGRLRPEESIDVEESPYRLHPVRLSDHETRRFYHGYSNGTLWPLFHSLPERMVLDRRNYEVFESVNARFAEAALEEMEEGDLVWVHDYQLVLCPELVRRRRPTSRLAFFLHIPFPPYDLFRILPSYREVLRGLLACDLVGFHSAGYVSNFFDCVERLLGARVDRERGRVEHGDRTVRVGAFPLGIDYDEYEHRARTAPRPRRPVGQQIVLGVDRLDYTKGIPERLLAYERLLELHRPHRGAVTMIQVAVPSREQVTEYQQLKRQIDELVGRINGRFGTSLWTPIHYINRSIPGPRLSALYRDASVALVTPLRDGMNLVAKEFVASQTDQPGVLVLSRMAGAAESMLESLLVNPYNIDSVADALHRALEMPPDQRETRMRALQRRERRHDLDKWLGDFLDAATSSNHAMAPVREADFDAWLGDFVGEHPLAVFLDFDGTLAPIAAHPSMVKLPAETIEWLERCVARPDTQVAIVSGRSLRDIRMHAPIDGLVYAGNHGLEIEGPGLDAFRHTDTAHYRERGEALAEALASIDVPGVWTEQKGATLTLHFREAARDEHDAIAQRARELILAAGFQARDALCAVEGRPPIGWDKGHAVLHVLRERYGPGWSESVRAIYVGDDETDEDAFRALLGLGQTFRVGPPTEPTRARRRLSGVGAVQTLLRWIAGRRPGRPLPG